MSEQSDPYRWWRRALELTGGTRALTREEMQRLGVTTEPQNGFYRQHNGKYGPFIPVAIFQHEGQPAVLVDDRIVPDSETAWTYACRWPITETAYRAKAAGEPWWDEDDQQDIERQRMEALTASPVSGPNAVLPAIGDNHPPEETELEALQRQITAAARNAETYAEITDDDTASKAQSVRSRLLDLGGDADKKREALKRPHLDAGKKIDTDWQPIIKAAKDAADKIRAALSAHETKKRQIAAKAAADLAEQQRQAAPAPSADATVAPQKAAAAPTQAPKDQIAGASGRKAAVKTIRIAVIQDQDAVYKAMRDRPEVAAMLQSLAQRAIAAGIDVPGVTVEERADVR